MLDPPPNQVLNESIVEAIFDLTLAVVVFFYFVIWRQCDQLMLPPFDRTPGYVA